jgi:hypothetical protein
VTATFGPAPPSSFTLTVSKPGGGLGTITGSGIACGTTCQQTYAPGAQVTLTAAPGTGNDTSTFVGWGGACASAGTNLTCSFSIQKDETVSANFRRVPIGIIVGPAPVTEPGLKALEATLTARPGCSFIRQIQFGTPGAAFNNARVSVTSPSGGLRGQTSGFVYTPPAGTTAVSLIVERVVPSGGATVSPIIFVDGCGEWRTLVGGGPEAFR